LSRLDMSGGKFPDPAAEALLIGSSRMLSHRRLTRITGINQTQHESRRYKQLSSRQAAIQANDFSLQRYYEVPGGTQPVQESIFRTTLHAMIAVFAAQQHSSELKINEIK